jgi:hypothetical protein
VGRGPGATEAPSRNRTAPSAALAAIFCQCARLVDFRTDFDGTAAGHCIAASRAAAKSAAFARQALRTYDRKIMVWKSQALCATLRPK